MTLAELTLAALAGIAGGAMNALAGGGTFATLPALIALGLPATIANATSNVSLLPGAATSTFAYRSELRPLGGVSVRRLGAITFAGGFVGSLLLVWTPGRAFDVIVPWLLLYATLLLAFGRHAAEWLRSRVTIGPRALMAVQALLGVYGGYFGGGIGLMMTATYGLLAAVTPRAMFAPRTLMLTMANLAAAFVFIGGGMVAWAACLPMLAGAVAGGWAGALMGKRLPAHLVHIGTILISIATTAVFFRRAYF